MGFDPRQRRADEQSDPENMDMGENTLFGPRGVLHPEPFPHYVGDGCNCPESPNK